VGRIELDAVAGNVPWGSIEGWGFLGRRITINFPQERLCPMQLVSLDDGDGNRFTERLNISDEAHLQLTLHVNNYKKILRTSTRGFCTVNPSFNGTTVTVTSRNNNQFPYSKPKKLGI